jgi:sec-independent protein translocase protein TatA
MIGSGELIVILGIMLLLFGGKRLPELAKSLGKGIREFKKACNEDTPEDSENAEKKLISKDDP